MQEVRQGAVQAPGRSQTGGTNQWDHDMQPVKVSCLQKRSLALSASRNCQAVPSFVCEGTNNPIFCCDPTLLPLARLHLLSTVSNC